MGPAAIGSLAGLSPSALSSALGGLSDADVAKLQQTCAQVLGAPQSYDSNTVAVCQVIASI
jgi:hypothetical protein